MMISIIQEGEIHCFVQTEEGGQLVVGNIVVTRCPALLPGDVSFSDAEKRTSSLT